MADNAPLRRIVSKVITEEMLDEIAREHAKGRFLLVATTNLDARRPTIWNMTTIAAYIPDDFDHPKREEFDQEYMRALFQLGYQRGSEGYPWDTQPPGMWLRRET
jgi:hypothetical protein